MSESDFAELSDLEEEPQEKKKSKKRVHTLSKPDPDKQKAASWKRDELLAFNLNLLRDDESSSDIEDRPKSVHLYMIKFKIELSSCKFCCLLQKKITKVRV